MTEDMEGTEGITESGGDRSGQAAFQEIGAEGFVLALFWGGGLEEKAPDSA